jgi:hypothetical protein
VLCLEHTLLVPFEPLGQQMVLLSLHVLNHLDESFGVARLYLYKIFASLFNVIDVVINNVHRATILPNRWICLIPLEKAFLWLLFHRDEKR